MYLYFEGKAGQVPLLLLEKNGSETGTRKENQGVEL